MDKILKEWLLFFIGNLIFILSGIWYFQDGGLEPIIGLVGSISTLVFDFIFQVKENKKKKTQEKADTSFAKKVLVVRVLIVYLSASIIYEYNLFYPSKKNIPPDLEFSTFEIVENNLKLTSLKRYPIADDFPGNKLKLNFRLAIRNNEEEPLKVVKIELRYPNWVSVRSEARGKIDPENKLIVYEHDFGTIEPSTLYTPIDNIDIIEIPWPYLLIGENWYIDYDNVPHSLVGVVDPSLAEGDTILSFKFNVFCENRPPFEGEFSVNLPTQTRLFTDRGLKILNLSLLVNREKDRFWFSKGELMDSWVMITKVGHKKIEYKKLKYSDGQIKQFFWVDDTLRKTIIGKGNGTMEQFENSGRDTIPDRYYKYKEFFMFDWKQETFQDDSI